MNKSSASFLPHVIAVVLFLLIPSIYFPEFFQGKVLNQSDIQGYKGMSKEITDYREETGKEALWTNSMFSGMPAYLISMRMPFNILTKVNKVLTYQKVRPIIHIFLYMLGFYILLLLFGVNPWLGIVGGIAYGFSSYFFIILEPGHITKAIALGYMPMIVGSVYYTFRKNYVIGGMFTSIFIGLQLVANHLQITYYTLLIVLIFGIFELISVIRKNNYSHFIKAIIVSIIAVLIAASVNIVNFWSLADYTKYSLRGPSELSSDQEDKTSGLDKSYATSWSYGVDESFNLLIPNFKGGASSILMADRDSKTFQFLSRTSNPQQAAQIINQNAYFFTQYWGTQPGTSGPVYLGAVVVFLFVFGMFFTKGQTRWWIFAVVVFSLLLSWGKNFMFLTDIFLDHFPAYNKFRTVSMILVMTQLAVPLLAILAVNRLIQGDYRKKEFLNSLKYSLYIVGGITLLFALIPTISDLSSPKDKLLIDQGASDLVNAIKEDRAALLRKDAIRSLIFILITAVLLYVFHLKKLKANFFYIGLGLLILVDLWGVNKRYLNDDNFVSKKNPSIQFQPTAIDLEILKDKDIYYRVYDLTSSNPFSDSRASYFHKSIGGYHGAKMRRYQEVFTRYMTDGLNENILDMLNTKYIISRNPESGQSQLTKRTTQLGNAWLVTDYKIVENADEEMEELGVFDPGKTVLVDKRFESMLSGKSFLEDSLSTIVLKKYEPNFLKYEYNTLNDKIVVFSDIYYDKGWTAKIDSKDAEYFRGDYILRAMVLPAGKGKIEFEFKPDAYFVGKKIAYGGSVMIILFILVGVWAYRKNKRVEQA